MMVLGANDRTRIRKRASRGSRNLGCEGCRVIVAQWKNLRTWKVLQRNKCQTVASSKIKVNLVIWNRNLRIQSKLKSWKELNLAARVAKRKKRRRNLSFSRGERGVLPMAPIVKGSEERLDLLKFEILGVLRRSGTGIGKTTMTKTGVESWNKVSTSGRVRRKNKSVKNRKLMVCFVWSGGTFCQSLLV